ncbi:class I SAM-dependent methyltransferase [Streptomyces sp. NPDC001739]|uniref:class I SAM-dependent methyltransferase n=1 Tax=Streptomyces sp. NPDC001633 TaxID=3364595 RepID=UPI00369F0CA4
MKEPAEHPPGPVRNDDADWDHWPVQDYLAENYREIHPCDAAVIRHHSAVYRRFAPGSIARSLEFGAGPNLYPLMLAGAASRQVDAVERSAANVAYLTGQLRHGPDESWQAFYAFCRDLDPALPPTATEALARVRVLHDDVRTLPAGTYELASMNFVAESITADFEEFAQLCHTYLATVRPGGHLVASFMENMPTYRIGTAPEWPGCPVDATVLREVFGPRTDELVLTHVDPDPTRPDYGDTGMVLLRARTVAKDGKAEAGMRNDRA